MWIHHWTAGVPCIQRASRNGQHDFEKTLSRWAEREAMLLAT
jgi:hypothetical protein